MKENILLNCLLILIKYMIYRNRKNEKFPTSIDKCKAVENSKNVKYEKKEKKGLIANTL